MDTKPDSERSGKRGPILKINRNYHKNLCHMTVGMVTQTPLRSLKSPSLKTMRRKNKTAFLIAWIWHAIIQKMTNLIIKRYDINKMICITSIT